MRVPEERRKIYASRLFSFILFLSFSLYPSVFSRAAWKLYLQDPAASVNPGSDDERSMTASPGLSLVTYTKNTVAGPVTPPTAATQFTKTAGGTVVTWYSYPLDAVTVSGNVTFNIWARESATSANATITAILCRSDNSGVIISTIATALLARTELTTALAAQNWTRTPTLTALSNGDRLAVRAYIDDGNKVTMAGGRTVTATLAGPTGGVSGDSWVQTAEGLAPARPATTSITGAAETGLTAGWQVVEAATGYMLAASVNPGNPPSPIASYSDVADVSATVGSLDPNTTYYLFVRTNGSNASSSWSAYPATATLANPPVFSDFSGVGSGAIQFNWSANGNPDPGTLYRALVSTAADPLNPAGAVVTSSDTYNLYLSSSGLSANKAWYFRVAAINHNNAATAYVSAVSTYTLAAVPAPAGFSNVGATGMDFNWSAAGNPAGTLYRALVSTAPDPLAPGGAAVTAHDSYSLSLATGGLAPNTTYYFRAAGVNSSGVESAYSSAASTSTLANAPLFSGFSGVGSAAIQSNWSAAGNSTGTLYRALVSTAPDPLNPSGAAVTSSDTYNLSLSSSGLAANTAYYFRAAAVNRNGVATAYSAAESVSTLLAFDPVFTNFTNVGTNAAEFNWSANGNAYPGTKFRVLSSTAPDPASPGGAAVTSSDTYNLSLGASGLSANVTYYFRAAGVNNDGALTGYSAAAGTSTLASVPSGFDFTGMSSVTVRIEWSGANGPGALYTVLVSTAPDPLAPGGAAATSSDTYNGYLSTSGLQYQTDYYFRVRAVNNNGVATVYSDAVTTKTLDAGALAAPVAESLTAYVSSITAAWSLVPGATGYTLAASVNPGAPPSPVYASSTTPAGSGASVFEPALSPDTVYYLFVRSNGPGRSSDWNDYPPAATLLAYAPAFTNFTNVEMNSANFNWSANGNPWPGTLFRVVSSTAPDPLAPGGAVAVASDTYNVYLSSTGLAANISYYFRAAGVNKDGAVTSWTSAQATSTLANAPVFANFTNVGINTAQFNWSANGNRNPGTLYRILVSTAPDPLSPAGAVVTASDTYNLSLSSSGLRADTAYYFRAAAVNNNGVFTSYTAARSTATLANDPVFTDFTNVGADSAQFNWSAAGNPADTLYRALVSTAPDPLNPGGAVVTASDTYNLSLSSSGLALNTAYYFRAAALGRGGTATAYTAAQRAWTLTRVPLFSGFSNVGDSSLDFNWTENGNPGGTLYRVVASTAPDPLNSGGAQVSSQDTTSLSVSSSGLAANTTYYFRAAGVNGDGAASAYTAPAGTSTLVAYAPAFAEFTNILTDALTFNWSANGNPDGTLYRVAVSTAPDPLAPAGAAATFSDTYDLWFASSGLKTAATYYFRAAGVNNNNVATAYTAAQSTRTLQTVTKLYLRDTASSANPGADDERRLAMTRGSSVVSYVKDTINGPVTPPTAATQFTRTAGGTNVIWYSGPLDAIAISGSVTFNIWAMESAGAANATITAELLRADNAGIIQSVIAAVLIPRAELATSAAAQIWTVAPTPTSLSSGERLAVRIYIDDGNGVTLAGGGRTVTVTLDGPTAGASGDSWVQTLEVLKPAKPATSGITSVAASQMTAGWQLVGETTGYTLAASANPGGAPSPVYASSDTLGDLSATVSVPALVPNTTYYLFARANGSDGSSDWAAYPGTSTLLAWPPAFTGFTNVAADAVRFDWSANGNAYPGTLFRVLVSTAQDPLNPAGAIASSSDTYNLYLSSSGLAADTTYYFRVAGINNNNVPTAYTAGQGTATLLAYPPVFTNFTNTGTNSVDFNWSANGNPYPGTLFRVLASTAPDPLSPAGAAVTSSDTYSLSLSSSGLQANAAYYFRVAGVNKNNVATAYTVSQGTATLAYAPVFTNFTNVGANTARFNWSANGNPPGTLYRAFASTAADPLAPGGAAATSSDTYNLYLSSSGLAADTTYYFRAAAVNGNGVATAYTLAQGTATLLAYPPAFADFTDVGAGAMQFNWSANGNAWPGTLYRVSVSTAPDPLAPAGAAVTSSDTYNLYLSSSGLAADTTYYFRAAGVNKNNVATAYTLSAGASTLLAYPPAFAGFTGVAESAIGYNWSANGNRYPGTLFRVVSSTAPDPLAPGGAVVTSSDTYSLSLISSGLAPNTTYYFRSAGINNNGAATFYAASAGTSTLAGQPADLYSTGITTRAIQLNWSAAGNGPGALYRVLTSTAPDPLSPAGAVATASDTYNVYLATSGLSPSTDYYFRAAAINNNGVVTAYAAPFYARTLAAGEIGSPASGGITDVGVSSIAASWSLVSGATGYTLAASLSADNPPVSVAASSTTVSGTGAAAWVFQPALSPDTVYYLFARANGDTVSGAWFAYPPAATLLEYAPAFVNFTDVGANSANFNWSANGNAYPGTKFRVLVSTAADPLAPAGAVVGSSDSYNVSLATSGLAANTTYYFRVAGVNKDGAVTAYTAAQATATLANAPVFTNFTNVGANTAEFNWSANGNPYPGTLFRVVSSTAPDPLAPGGAAVTSSDTYNLYLASSGLVADTAYYFRAAAVGRSGAATAYTLPQGTATLLAYPPVFTDFTNVGVSSVQFNWSANGNAWPGTLYRVLSSTAPDPLNPGGAVAASSETYNLYLASSGLAANATWYFRVAGLNRNRIATAYAAAAGTSTLANIPLSAVSTFSAVSAGGFTAAWNANSNPAGTLYGVQVSTAQDFNAGASEQFSASTAPLYGASYSFTGLLSSREYYFRVRGRNNNGVYTAYANLGSTRTLQLPAPATQPITQVSTWSVTASWSLVAGATGYTLAASVNGGSAPSPVYASSTTLGDPGATVFEPALSLNATYYLFVRANGPADAGPWAAWPATSTLANPPLSAASTFSSVGFNSFSVSWDGNSNPLGLTKYVVQVSTAQDFNAGATDQVTFSTVPVSGPGAAFSGLSSDAYYYFRVRTAHNNGNFTAWAGLGFVKTLKLPVMHSAGDGVVIYGQAGNSMPQFRNYYSAGNNFSAVQNTVSGVPGSLFVIRTNPLTSKQEAVAGYVRNGTLRVLCTDGANWYEEWTQNVGGGAATRRFDIAYETNSGDVLVLYSNNASGTNELGYRTKPGSADCGSANWSAHTNLDPARTSGVVQWVKTASDRRADYDTIAAIWADANSDLSAMVWNGTSWENEPAAALETSLEAVASVQDVEDFDVEFESLSGDLMAVWANSAGADGVNGVRYATAAWTGGAPLHAWGSPVTPATFLDDATNLDLAANPAGDEMIFASVGNAGSDLQTGYWSGSAWTNTANVDTTAQTPLAGTKLVAAVWLSSSTTTRWVVAYNDSAATNIGWYYGATGTPTLGTDAAPAPAFANPQTHYEMWQDPVNRDRAVLAVSDNASDLIAKRLVMTPAAAFTWSDANGGSALEADLSSTTVGGRSFVFWPAPPTTTFEQSAYRFFANTDTADVGAPLAAQNALAVLGSAGSAFRLRALAHVGQVDLPLNGQGFKLQFAGKGDGTCAAPANGAPAAYTDVTASTILAFKDNAPADNAALTANAADPKHGAHATVNQAYEELNNSTNSVAGVTRNQDGMWDFALRDNGLTPGAVYCLRLVKGDGNPLEYYTVYPQIMLSAVVYINEVYPSGASGSEDWVELYNNTASTPSLTGWKLNYVENTIDLGGSPNTLWTGQPGDAINAFSTFTVANLPLNLNGGQSYHVKLVDAASNLADQAQWPVLAAGRSFARISDGNPSFFEIDPTPTRNYANFISTDALKINEVGYAGQDRRFVEIYNASSVSTRTLAGYALRNSAASESGLVFRFTREIYPLNYAVVDFSSLSDEGKTFQQVFGSQGPDAAGDFLTLENSTGSTVDMVTWQSGSAYSRYDYKAAKVSFTNYAPAGAAKSIMRQPTEGADTGSNSADFASSAFATLGSRNNGAGAAVANTLAYPLNTSAPQFLAGRFPVTLTLGADSSAGYANSLVFQRTGGAADARSPHVYRLQDLGFNLSSLAQQTTVQYGPGFSDQDGWPLVSSAVYRVTLNTDTGAQSAPQIILGTVTWDGSVHAVTGSTVAPSNMNNAARDSMIRLDVSNNSPAGFNSLEVATVAFKIMNWDLSAPLTTTEAKNLFNALMLVRDSTSAGVYGVYESAVDISTLAYIPMADISLDAAGLSTLTVAAPDLPSASVPAASTRTFYVVFESTRNASERSPNAFSARFNPPGAVSVRDGPGGAPQDFTPSAQVDTSSVTLIAPAQPPAGTDWPYAPPAQTTIGAPVGVYNGAAVSSSVYVAFGDGVLRTLYSTGTVRWQFATSSPIITSPDVQEEAGQVYIHFANDGGDVYRLRDDGSGAFQSWKRNLGAGVRVRSDIMNSGAGKLYLGANSADAGTYRIYCLNKADGGDCAGWTFSAAVQSPISGTMSIDDYTGINSGWIGLEDGQVVGFQTGDASSNRGYVGTSFQPTPVMPIKTSPYVDSAYGGANNNLYIASTNGRLYSRTSSNLTVTPGGWTDFDAGSPIYSSPFVATLSGVKYVFVGADNGKLYKIDAANGGPSPVWAYQAGGAVRTMPVVVPAGPVGLAAGQDYVYFGSDDGYIYAVNANNGTLRTPGWPVKTGGAVRANPVIDLEKKTLVVGSNDGRTYTLNIGP